MPSLSACSPSRLHYPNNSGGHRSRSRSNLATPGSKHARYRIWTLVPLATLLLAGASGASSQSLTLQPQWNQQSPATIPTARFGNTLAFDAANSQLVMFGGFINSGDANDTWLWDGTNWTQANPANSPSARSNQSMIYDPAQGQVVMFGGSTIPAGGGGRVNETWLWNGTNWTQVTGLSTIPPARSSAAMGYYAPSGQVVLFGGLNASGQFLGDTWVWNGSNWSPASPSNSPTARFGAAMAYDAALGELILFGGFDTNGTEKNDTWAWNGSNWTNVTPSSRNPPVRDGAAMAYDPELGQVVMFGGVNNLSGIYLNDTWLWNGTSWTQQSTPSSPAARSNGGMDYDTAEGQMVMFGGISNSSSTTTFSDTWTFAPLQNFGNVNVCPLGLSTPAPCTETVTLTYNVLSTTAFSATQIVTQGAPGLDFTEGSSNTCTGTLNAGSTCSVSVTFTPQAPGLRLGAVEFFSVGRASPLVTTSVYGIGQTPEVAFLSGPAEISLGTGSYALSGPKGVAVDAAANVYIADSGNGRVLEELAVHQTQTLYNPGGSSSPTGVAVDGAGNVFIADPGLKEVVEVPAGGGTSTVVYTAAPNSDLLGVAVDGAGDVFIADGGLGEVVEILANGGGQIVLYNPGMGSGTNPAGVAVDGAGDVFVADAGLSEIVEIPAGCVTSGCQIVGSGWVTPMSVSVDAAGDVYVADPGNSAVEEVPAGCLYNFCAVNSSSNGIQSYGATVDAKGDVFAADNGNNQIDIFEESIAPPINFGSAQVGSANDFGYFEIQNVGNQTLTGSVGQPTNPSFIEAGPSCGSVLSLTAGATCTEGFTFSPLTSGPLSGDVYLTDNSLNGTPATQDVGLQGTGTLGIFSLSVTVSGSGGGTVTSNSSASPSVNCLYSYGTVSGTCSESDQQLTVVTLTAAANAGSTFVGWSGACSGTTPTCMVTMNSATTVSAIFEQGIFGVAKVCPGGVPSLSCTGSSLAVTFNPTTSATISAIQVLTQGTAGLDFQLGIGSTCIGPIHPGVNCTVNVNFAPLAPGLRLGAVELISDGSMIETQEISGIGQAPEIAFAPSLPAAIDLGGYPLSSPVAVDAAGNIYVASSGQVVEKTASGTKTSGSEFYGAAGIAVDGAGDVFVADNEAGLVVEISASGLTAPVYGGAPYDVALDGQGDVFVPDTALDEVIEISANGSQTVVYGPTTGAQPVAVAVDGAGDLFIALNFPGSIVEVPAGCANSSCQTTVGTGWNAPSSLAVDAAGDLFVADPALSGGNGVITEVPPGCTSATCQAVLADGTTTAGGVNSYGLAVDGLGNVYYVNTGYSFSGGGSGTTQLIEIPRSQLPTLVFSGTTVAGTDSSPLPVTIQNTGNLPLNVQGLSVGMPFAQVFSSGDNPADCNASGTFALTASQSCTESISFEPPEALYYNADIAFTDNSLNSNFSPIQQIDLAGTGQSAASSYMLTVTDVGAGSGTVTDNSSEISCSQSNGTVTGTCSGNYSSGASVTLNANPAPGSVFLGWGGACGGFTPTCQVSMTQAFSVTASFAQQNFGSVNVCQPGQTTPAPCSASIPITINIPTTTTIGAIQVVTQGFSGLDFSQGSGGTCTGTITGGTACTVNVNFAPLAPGLRMGAVELYDNHGNLILTTPIYGIGQAPVAAFGPGASSVVPTTGLHYNVGLAYDAAGNLFIADYSGSGAGVVKISPGGVQTAVPATGLSAPVGVAVDGAGDLFIVDLNLPYAIEVTPGGVQTTVGSGLSFPIGIAVDGAGDVFIGDQNNNRVVEVTPSGIQTTVPATGLDQVWGVAADGAGDVFIADGVNKRVVKVTPGGVQTTVPAIGLGQPYDLSVDAAGDVFIADPQNARVVEVPADGSPQTTVGSGLNYPSGVTLDGAGDVFIADQGSGQVFEVTRSLPPSLSFDLTNVGSASSDSPQIVTLQNVGNEPLTGSATFNIGANFSVVSTCNPSFTLIPGAACSENFGFLPQSAGYQTGSAAFSDNSFNLSSSVSLQTVNLSGSGGLNGQPVGVLVPNVVGLTQTAASSSIAGTGLTLGSASTASNNVVPSGSVIASNPAAGTLVNPGSQVNLLISSGQAPPPPQNPLNLLNNFFVTGDYAEGGVTLRGTGVGGTATGTIQIADSSTSPGSQGVPDGADIIDGFLYWMTLENTPAPSGDTGTFLGYPITGQQIGSDISYTDGPLTGTLRVYRADVNSYFPVATDGSGIRTGSGTFTVSLPDSGGSGFPVTEGASLVVIYRVMSPDFPLKSIVIYDGSAVPATSTNQNLQGFYDALGGESGEITTLSYTAGAWNSSSTAVSLAAHASQYSAPLNSGTAYAAEIFSTPVSNSDNDGILDAWKAGPPAGDFFAGQPGYYDTKTRSWVPLPGALHGEKDLFVQIDYMCGAVFLDGTCDPNEENLFPAPDANGNDPLAMVKNAFAAIGVVLHVEIGNAVPETTCTDNTSTNPPQLCQFPNEPGVIGWKNSVEFSKVWPKNLASCAAGGDCSPRFPYGQKDSYHYVLFGHSLAIPAWNSRYRSLTGISVNNGITTITTIDRGAEGSINYCPSRITIAGVMGNPGLNGVYNTTSCADSKHITVATPGVSNWVYPNSTLPEPGIGITFGTVTSISGYSDLGGSDSAVSLGLWETNPNQDMSKRANVIAGTLFHELGHPLGLTHGGLYYDHIPSYVPTFEENCKPNYQSVMNYLFQLDGLGPNATVAYSNQSLDTLTSSSLASVTSLTAGPVAATFPTSSWYSPTAPSLTASPASMHCDGTPLTGDTGYRINGPVAPITPPWSNGQNIGFDGVPPNGSIPYDPFPYTTLRGYNDVANLDLRQVGATGGEFASFASIMPFGSLAAPLNIAPGGSVSVTAGGTVALGSGGTVTLGSGGTVTLGSGGTIALGSGGSVTLNQTSNVTLGSGGTIVLGSGGTVALGSGGTVTLGSGGTVTLGSGGTIVLGSGGTVTLGSGGTIALGSGGSVTIPSTGGSYTIPDSGGTITLGSGGTVALGSGGTITLGSGGTIAMGSGGTVALGSGGTVTLGSGGTIVLGSGGTIALGSGGTVTLGSGGTITLGSGGTVTLGSGGTVTLGSGGTVTMGSGGTVALGSGGTVTLGSGGTVALGSGGTVALGSGGTVTLGSGGTIALGSGGTVALGSGGTVTLGSGGTIALGSGGTIALGSGGTVTLSAAGTLTVGGTTTNVGPGPVTVPAGGTIALGSGGTVALGSGGTVTLGSGGTIALGSGGTVALGSGGTVTLGSGGTITMGSGGTVTLGSGGTVTLGSGGTVALGSGGTIALGSGGTIALGSGGTVTLGSGGSTTTEMDYTTANSFVRPPMLPTYMVIPAGIQVSWMAPAFGVVQTYTISRSVNGGPPVVIGSVSGVNGQAPATTFTDTNPPVGTLVYTISTTLLPDSTNPAPRQSGPSVPAVLAVNQTIVFTQVPSSAVLGSTQPTVVAATAESSNSSNTQFVPNMQLVSFSASGQCSVGSSTLGGNGFAAGTSWAAVTLEGTGTCTITASQAGDITTATTGQTAYIAADPVSATFRILPPGSTTQSQTITFGPVPNVEYGSGFSVSATSSSGQPVSFSSSTGGTCTVGSTTGTASGAATGAGWCTITASAPAGHNVSAASVSATFYVFPAPLAVSAINVASAQGQPPSLPSILNVTYSLSGFVHGDQASAIVGAPALSTTATAGSGLGNYPIMVSTGTLAAANYSFLYVPGTLTIVQGTPTSTSLVSSTGGTSNYGQLVTFTPTVTGTPAPPAGDSVFYSYTNSTINGGSPVYLGGVLLGNGGYSTFLLPPGTNTITATFNFDPNPADTSFVPDAGYQSSSASVNQVVTPAPVAFLSPQSLTFPSTDDSSTSASTSVVLTNVGPAPLNISGIQIVSGDSGPADFVIQSSTCGSVLQPGPPPPGPPAVTQGGAASPAPPSGSASAANSCSVTLAFAPKPKQSGDVRTGTLVFNDNDGGQAGASNSVALIGSALSTVRELLPMSPTQTIAAGNYIWFNSELSVGGPLDPVGNPVVMDNGEVQIMVTNGSISLTNPANGTTTTVPVPDALIQFVPGLTSASTTFDAANDRWVTQIPLNNAATGSPKFASPGRIFVTGIPYLVPAAISQALSGGGTSSAKNVTWSAQFTTDTPGVQLSWEWGAANYNPCFGNQPTNGNPNCAGDVLSPSNLSVLGVISSDPGRCPFDRGNNNSAGTPYNFINDLVSSGPSGGTTGVCPYTGETSTMAGVVPAVTPVNISPSPLVFMPVNAGQTSSPMTLTIANTNKSLPFNLSGVSLTGANPADFAITGTTCTSANGPVTVSANSVGPLTIGPVGSANNSCTLSVVFKPGDLGARTSSLVFTYATPAGMDPNETPPPQTVNLYGTGAGGTNPIVGLSAVKLNFPRQVHGATSASQTVTLVNAGGGALTINSITPKGEYGETSTCPLYPSTLASGQTCTISVWFQPSATVLGTQTGSITITDNNNGVSGSTQTIQLSGQATP